MELCILATKGHPKRVNAAVHQVIVSHIEEHSKKPQEARERIVSLMGDLPRIDCLLVNPTRLGCVAQVDSSITQGGFHIGLCTRTQRFNQSQNQGHVQSDPKAAGLLYRRGACRRTAVLFAP